MTGVSVRPMYESERRLLVAARLVAVAGVSIFDAEPDEVQRITAGDPAVQGGVLTVEVYAVIGFPGDCLPGQPVTRTD